MKLRSNQLILGLLGLTVLMTFACSNTSNESEKEYTVVSGKVINPVNSKLLLYPYDMIPRNITNMDRFYQKALEIDEQGYFYDSLETKGQSKYFTMFNLKVDDVTRPIINSVILFLKTKDSLNFVVSNEMDSLISAQGSTAEINKYVFKKQRKISKWIDSLSAANGANNYHRRIMVLDSLLKRLLEKESKKLPAEYIDFETKNLFYKNLFYNFNNSDYSKKIESIIDSIGLDNSEEYFTHRWYKELVSSKISELSRKLVKRDSIDENIAKLIIIYKSIDNKEIRNDLLYKYVIVPDLISRLDYPHFEEVFTLFKLISTDDNYNELVSEIYESRIRLLEGSPSPDFSNYHSYESSKMSLKDFRGKYVYIDIWATWCRFCFAEFPALKELETNYSESNIDFIGISVDSDDKYETWEKTIENRNLGGIQLFADKSFESDFMKAYKVSALPRFILIDPEGNIVNANAPKPSSPELIDLFEKVGIHPRINAIESNEK